MNNETAKEIARQAANGYQPFYLYIPKNIEEFIPHDWVIDAIMDAYQMGKRDSQ